VRSENLDNIFSSVSRAFSFSIEFKIDSDNIYNMDDGGNTYFKRLYTTTLCNIKTKPPLEEDYVIALEKLSEIMKSIKFNKYEGLYQTNETKKDELTADVWQSIFGCGEHIEYKFYKCCVCLDVTKSTTYNCCNKNLCYECWDKIPSPICQECTSEDCCECVGACGTPRCPLCRCSLASGNEYEL
jgi:hypothetical protein